MKYNFDQLINRRGTDCTKWDEVAEGVLPLWVADMDFETAPCIIDALRRRVEHGVYGYALVPETFYERIIWWNHHRRNWDIDRQWILYTTGVVPALSAIIKGLCRPGDGVLFFVPAYNCFFSSVRNNGCRSIEFPITWSPTEERYTVDFAALEQTLSVERPRMMLLCNPHNPSGRVWTARELQQIALLCHEYGVIVLSDEIHCEFINPDLGRPFLPFAPIADQVGVQWVTASAPSKAFNTAGLKMAYIVCPNADFRQRIDRAINDNEVCDVNPFSFLALQAAYTPEGEEWLRQLVDYIYDGYRQFRADLKAAFPQLPIAHLEGTYLAWVDVSQLSSLNSHPSARPWSLHTWRTLPPHLPSRGRPSPGRGSTAGERRRVLWTGRFPAHQFGHTTRTPPRSHTANCEAVPSHRKWFIG